jgi:hypothetical protein
VGPEVGGQEALDGYVLGGALLLDDEVRGQVPQLPDPRPVQVAMQQFVEPFARQLLQVHAGSEVVLGQRHYPVPVVEQTEGQGADARVYAQSDFG